MNEYPPNRQPATTTRCLVPGCRYAPGVEGARLAVPGTGMCRTHHDRFPRILGDLVNAWPDLQEAVHRPIATSANSKVSTSGLADVSSAWNPHATEAMTQIADWAQFLVRLVLTECPVPPPEVRSWERAETVRDEHTGQRLETPRRYQHTQTVRHSHALTMDTPTRLQLAALAKHYGHWLSSYPGEPPLGPALLVDALELRRVALAALQAEPVRRVGYKDIECSQTVDMDDWRELYCGSPMVVILDGHGEPGVLVCARHPKSHTQYQAREWMEFARDA